MNLVSSRALLLAAMALLAQNSMAGVVINSTRVIYPAQSHEVTVQLENVGDSPALVQAWVDSGDASQTADESISPFVLAPPISRVEPGRGQALRLMYAGTSLPTDRESVFWLNVLDIPPSPKSAEGGAQNYLQVAFRSRIKIFYRPQGLEGTADRAPAALRWARSAGRLEVENPTPFHVTISELYAVVGNKEEPIEQQDAMVGPKKSLQFVVPANMERVRFITINDYGGRNEHIVNPGTSGG